MRNLKKVLSLTLALVMMLGMMTFAGAAETAKITSKDLTDMNDVANKEQVSLLVDLGIVNGIKQADGTYKYAPKDTINRASYAKMVYTIMMGDATADVYKGVNTGLKDVAGHWAEGYIGYCVTTKLAVGDGKGSFNPDANITTVSAAKMLLVALGYDAKASGYEGDALWSINIMRDAQKAGLLNNVDQKASENLTRDNAAQLIYNALFANTVVPDFQYDMGVKYLRKYDADVTTLGESVYGLAKVVAVVDEISNLGVVTLTHVPEVNDSSATTTAKSNAVAAAAAVAHSGFKFTPEMAGTTVVFYSKNAVTVVGGKTSMTYKNLYSTAPVAGTTKVLHTVTSGIANQTALTKMITTGDAKFKVALAVDPLVATEYKVTFYLNGVKKTDSLDLTINSFDAPASILTSVVKAGTLVEFIDAGTDNKADIVKVTEKKVATLTADPATKVVSGENQIRVPGVINSFVATDTVVGAEGLKKGDVVLYVAIGTITYIEKAASVEGVAVAKNSDGAIKVDGTYYDGSQLFGTSYTSSTWTDYKNTYTLYLDNGKNIIKTVALTAEANSNYAMVLNTSWVGGNGDLASSNYAQAKLLFADGTTDIVKLSKVKGATPVNTGAVPGYDADSGSGTTALNVLNDGNIFTGYKTAGNSTTPVKFIGIVTSGHFEGKFMNYTKESDGRYALTVPEEAASSLDGGVLTAGKANFNGAHIGNANTLFLVAGGTDDAPTYKVYTGIANVPGMATATGAVLTNDAGIATHVYVSATGTITGSVGQYVYIPSAKGNLVSNISYVLYPATSTTNAYYGVQAIFNGVAKEIKLASATGVFTADYSSLTANALFTVGAISADEVISTLTAVADGAGTAIDTGVKSIAGNTLLLATDGSFTYDADTAVYFINADGEVSTIDGAAIPVDDTDVVFVAFDTTTRYAKSIYVMQKISTTKAVTGDVEVYVNGSTTKAVITGGDLKVAGTMPAASSIGDVITLKVPVSPEATYTVAPHVVVTGDSSATYTFVITIIAEDGSSNDVNFVLTFLAVS